MNNAVSNKLYRNLRAVHKISQPCQRFSTTGTVFLYPMHSSIIVDSTSGDDHYFVQSGWY